MAEISCSDRRALSPLTSGARFSFIDEMMSSNSRTNGVTSMDMGDAAPLATISRPFSRKGCSWKETATAISNFLRSLPTR